MRIRNAETADLQEVVDLLMEAFRGYPFFDLYDLPRTQSDFFRHTINIWVRLCLVREHIYVAEKGGRIVGAISLRAPGDIEPGLLDFLQLGGMTLIKLLGLKETREVLNYNFRTDNPMEHLPQPNYQLTFLAVLPDAQNQNVGTSLIQKCAVPLIKRSGGGRLSLNTQTERDCAFYRGRGFEAFNTQIVPFHDRRIESTSFVRMIEP